MKGVDLYGRVRFAVQREGLSNREAARRFGIDPRTVAKMLLFSVPPGYRRSRPPKRPKLDPFIGIIDQILEDYKIRPAKQRHTAQRIFERLRDEHGHPDILVVDNGLEFTGRDLENWAHEHGVKLFFIDPGKPMQNGSIGSFNCRFRDECLDPHWFRSLDEAGRIIERCRLAYNETRPHTALRMSTPKALAAARPFERPRQAAPAPELSRGSPPEPLAALCTPVLSQTGRFNL